MQIAERLPNKYEFIIQEEGAYRTTRVPLASNWRDWNMYEHIDRSFLLKNSRFYLGQQDYTRPFNNIILPIANVNYRSEGFDVKDVELYVDNQDNYHKSFVARKFHTRWARENDVDGAIDESVESYFDYGLILLKNVGESRPEVVDLQQIVFCDQTDIMSGPLCLKHHYSPAELTSFEGRWNKDAIDKAILMARTSKDVDAADGDNTETPGKYIEVYELHGMFPVSWLSDDFFPEDVGKYSPQIHIVTFYVSPEDGKRKGITLFSGKESKPIFKALKRDPIPGRACGRGGIEELFHAQIWTNYSDLHVAQMLEAVSKVILTTNNKSIVSLNNFKNMKQGQILDVGDGGRIEQLQIQAINKNYFDQWNEKWQQVGRGIGSASDPQLGINPVSGTPLGTTEIVTSQGIGIHEYRKGKIAQFWRGVYRDWVLPHLQGEINKGHKWLDELSLNDMEDISKIIVIKERNKKIKKLLLEGTIPTEEEIAIFEQVAKTTFERGGNKRFIEALKDEFSDLPMDIEISVSGKQENLAETVSQLNSLFRVLFTPGAVQVLQQEEGLRDLLNEILEKSGISPVGFSGFMQQSSPPAQQPVQQPAQPGVAPEQGVRLPVTT